MSNDAVIDFNDPRFRDTIHTKWGPMRWVAPMCGWMRGLSLDDWAERVASIDGSGCAFLYDGPQRDAERISGDKVSDTDDFFAWLTAALRAHNMLADTTEEPLWGSAGQRITRTWCAGKPHHVIGSATDENAGARCVGWQHATPIAHLRDTAAALFLDGQDADARTLRAAIAVLKRLEQGEGLHIVQEWERDALGDLARRWSDGMIAADLFGNGEVLFRSVTDLRLNIDTTCHMPHAEAATLLAEHGHTLPPIPADHPAYNGGDQ